MIQRQGNCEMAKVATSFVFAIAVGFSIFGITSCSRGGAQVPQSTSEPPTVAVAKAALADLSSSLLLTAEFEPFQEVDVMAKVSG